MAGIGPSQFFAGASFLMPSVTQEWVTPSLDTATQPSGMQRFTPFQNPLLLALLGPGVLSRATGQPIGGFTPFANLHDMTEGGPFTPSYGTDSEHLQAAFEYEERKNALSDVQPWGPQTTIQERGAGRYRDYADMTAFARDHGSLDGTPITADSTYGQDVMHLGDATSVLRHALETRAQEAASQALEMKGRIHGNIYHKWRHYRSEAAVPPSMQSYFKQSPFNPDRQIEPSLQNVAVT